MKVDGILVSVGVKLLLDFVVGGGVGRTFTSAV